MPVTDVVDEEPVPSVTADAGWFVYGIVDAATTLPEDLTGIDAEPVRTIRCGRVAAVVTEVATERPPGRGAELLAYSAVLDTLAYGTSSVVPVQFGAILPDGQTVRDELLAPDEDYFAELLSGLAGRKQFVFQALYDEQSILSEVVAADPEIARLRELTRDLPEDAAYGDRVRLGELVAGAVEVRREADAALLLDEVLGLTEAYDLRPVSGLERVVDAALLVADAHRDEFENRLERLAEECHGRMRLRLMGPTAPYDFVGST